MIYGSCSLDSQIWGCCGLSCWSIMAWGHLDKMTWHAESQHHGMAWHGIKPMHSLLIWYPEFFLEQLRLFRDDNVPLSKQGWIFGFRELKMGWFVRYRYRSWAVYPPLEAVEALGQMHLWWKTVAANPPSWFKDLLKGSKGWSHSAACPAWVLSAGSHQQCSVVCAPMGPTQACYFGFSPPESRRRFIRYWAGRQYWNHPHAVSVLLRFYPIKLRLIFLTYQFLWLCFPFPLLPA